MTHFLVESYLPPGAELPVAVDEAAGAEAHRARLLQTLYAPDDELCYCLFEGESAREVESLSRAAGLAVDRLVMVRLAEPRGGA